MIIDEYFIHCLLKKDTQGEKSLKKIVGMTNLVVVLHGELLRPIPRGEIQPRSDGVQHNHYVEREPSVTLYAAERDVSPLSPKDYHLLRAIKSPVDRFSVFSHPKWLEWGRELNVDKQVYVCLPDPSHSDSVSTWSTATMRYKGAVKCLPGTTFGVEITVGGYSANLACWEELNLNTILH